MRFRPSPQAPGPGQESVWDYPRPPAVRACRDRIRVILGGVTVCDTSASWQVLETSHPPTYYLPREAFAAGALRPATGSSFCEWKGVAAYLDVVGGDRAAERAAWHYPTPTPEFAMLSDHLALYAGRMDHVTVGGETVTPQPGEFYAGWITSTVTGPFKGIPGSQGW